MNNEQNIEIETIRRNKAAFGAVVERRRIAAGLEQRVFSRMVKIANSHLRQIERGEVGPTLSTMTKIALALDTDVADLMVEMCEISARINPAPLR